MFLMMYREIVQYYYTFHIDEILKYRANAVVICDKFIVIWLLLLFFLTILYWLNWVNYYYNSIKHEFLINISD